MYYFIHGECLNLEVKTAMLKFEIGNIIIDALKEERKYCELRTHFISIICVAANVQ
jgi:hypothetical protein